MKLSDETVFTGDRNTYGPVAEKTWLPAGEYRIGSYDTNKVNLCANNDKYWITRADFEEVKHDLGVELPIRSNSNDL